MSTEEKVFQLQKELTISNSCRLANEKELLRADKRIGELEKAASALATNALDALPWLRDMDRASADTIASRLKSSANDVITLLTSNDKPPAPEEAHMSDNKSIKEISALNQVPEAEVRAVISVFKIPSVGKGPKPAKGVASNLYRVKDFNTAYDAITEAQKSFEYPQEEVADV